MTLSELIRAAISEDLPDGDLTTESLGLTPRPGRARLIAKQDLVLSGSPAFEQTICYLDPMAKVTWHFEEGDSILNRQVLCTLLGDLVQILKAERTALNFLTHLCGISTFTHRFRQEVKGTQTKICATRKTTPGYRELEKKAVIHGGGVIHRGNLSTTILLKDNHIAVMGGIRAAVQRARQNSNQAVEVEARTLEEVQECIDLKLQRILLDNMDNETLKKALKLIPPQIETEASGNITLERVGGIAALGVQSVSIGALTHSAPTADISLLFDWD